MPATKNIKKDKSEKRPIGVFDSGVGGLSVLIELEKLLPNENFVFLADQKNVPYGEKSKNELVGLVYRIADYFIKHHDVKMIVVACNTATCGAIHELRNKYSVPIVGTVPAIKKAAEMTKTGVIASISTPSTSKSEAVKKIIEDYCQNIEVLNIGCKNLENAVETGELKGDQVNDLLQTYLKDVKNSKVDYLVLGCTHYPFLKSAIRKIVGRGVKLLDGGKAIAKRAKSLLKEGGLASGQKRPGRTTYFTTDDSAKFSTVSSLLLGTKIKAEKVEI